MVVNMDKATIRERILLHLSRFSMVNEDEVYNLPFDLTQDGIASALGISRAHSSLELKKLRQGGKIKENQVHVIGSNIRRKVYYLEPDGKAESECVRERLEGAGVSIETILDMRRCDPELMWERLSSSDRDALGLACVIRVPVNKSLLPPTDAGVIPATHEGLVKISPEVKQTYLDAIGCEHVRRWNSEAADWWMDNITDDQERLYHLVTAGRSIESNRLLVRKSDGFLMNCNEDLLKIVENMEDPIKDIEAVWSVRAKIAIACDCPEYAEKCLSELRNIDSNEVDILDAEIKYARKNFKDSLSDSKMIYDKTRSARAAMLTGRSLFALGEYDAAEDALAGTVEEFSALGDVSRIDEVMILRAGIAYEHKDKGKCLSLLGKAMHSAHSAERKDSISELADAVRSGKTVPVFD